MITDQQREQAALFALGLLGPADEQHFAAELRANTELRELVRSLQDSVDAIASTAPRANPPAGLKQKILAKIQSRSTASPAATAQAIAAGLQFIPQADSQSGWKQLPITGAWIKLLSFEPARGYAVLLGKLDRGVRYPAHINAGPEDFYILTGDLHVGNRVMGPGDFHHADAGSHHEENFSVEGCTLLAVLTADDPLVVFAMA